MRTALYSFFKRALKTEKLIEFDNESIDNFVKNQKLVIFMKGNHENPKCGFSNAALQILALHHSDNLTCVDIFQDAKLAPALKIYSNWPTFPQIYIKGKLIGGYDILLQLHQSGEIIEMLKEAGIESNLKNNFAG